ncbi:hypothetical protein [Sinorhizobium medicae]|uniref:hypothetical protein n=1 Tax=Sinorhizobium medicae TaxID=110321 RepID=UPI000FD8E631|nr:hypothetical protein [Sinorhizobium medicae]RVI59082.1 hypothetical protein CN192_05850 [Sinorhizobium medicae]
MKKPADHDPSLHPAVVACALIAAAVIMLASLTGDGKSLEAWVNRYQTLITGFFAVGAAYLTVWQMRKTDAESERRHQELASLQMRADRLRMERASNPQLADLRACVQSVDLLCNETMKAPEGRVFTSYLTGEWAPPKPNEWAFQLSALQKELTEILARPQFEAGEALFHGELAERVFGLRRETLTIGPTLGEAIQHLSEEFPSEESEFRFGEWYRENGELALIKYVVHCSISLPGVIAGMEFVAREYEVEAFHNRLRPSPGRW